MRCKTLIRRKPCVNKATRIMVREDRESPVCDDCLDRWLEKAEHVGAIVPYARPIRADDRWHRCGCRILDVIAWTYLTAIGMILGVGTVLLSVKLASAMHANAGIVGIAMLVLVFIFLGAKALLWALDRCGFTWDPK